MSWSTPWEKVIAVVPYPKDIVRITVSGNRFTLYNEESSIGGFELTQLPNCCGVVVSGGAWVLPSKQGLGYGKSFAQYRLELARAARYGMIQATVQLPNEKQCHILRSKGYERTTSFVNPKTGNTVAVFEKIL